VLGARHEWRPRPRHEHGVVALDPAERDAVELDLVRGLHPSGVVGRGDPRQSRRRHADPERAPREILGAQLAD